MEKAIDQVKMSGDHERSTDGRIRNPLDFKEEVESRIKDLKLSDQVLACVKDWRGFMQQEPDQFFDFFAKAISKEKHTAVTVFNSIDWPEKTVAHAQGPVVPPVAAAPVHPGQLAAGQHAGPSDAVLNQLAKALPSFKAMDSKVTPWSRTCLGIFEHMCQFPLMDAQKVTTALVAAIDDVELKSAIVADNRARTSWDEMIRFMRARLNQKEEKELEELEAFFSTVERHRQGNLSLHEYVVRFDTKRRQLLSMLPEDQQQYHECSRANGTVLLKKVIQGLNDNYGIKHMAVATNLSRPFQSWDEGLDFLRGLVDLEKKQGEGQQGNDAGKVNTAKGMSSGKHQKQQQNQQRQQHTRQCIRCGRTNHTASECWAMVGIRGERLPGPPPASRPPMGQQQYGGQRGPQQARGGFNGWYGGSQSRSNGGYQGGNQKRVHNVLGQQGQGYNDFGDGSGYGYDDGGGYGYGHGQGQQQGYGDDQFEFECPPGSGSNTYHANVLWHCNTTNAKANPREELLNDPGANISVISRKYIVKLKLIERGLGRIEKLKEPQTVICPSGPVVCTEMLVLGVKSKCIRGTSGPGPAGTLCFTMRPLIVEDSGDDEGCLPPLFNGPMHRQMGACMDHRTGVMHVDTVRGRSRLQWEDCDGLYMLPVEFIPPPPKYQPPPQWQTVTNRRRVATQRQQPPPPPPPPPPQVPPPNTGRAPSPPARPMAGNGPAPGGRPRVHHVRMHRPVRAQDRRPSWSAWGGDSVPSLNVVMKNAIRGAVYFHPRAHKKN